MELTFDTTSVESYRQFLAVKRLPTYRIRGRVAEFPDEYARRLGIGGVEDAPIEYQPSPFLFDYQRDIAALAIRKQKFAVFADCGLGKSLIEFEFARQAAASLPDNRCALILTPLMVIPQMLDEYERFYGSSTPIERIKSSDLQSWLDSGTEKIGITNWEALKDDDLRRGRLGALIPDESSLLKSHYGKYGQRVIELGKGLDWKLCGTGTPAPNDRIEYGNHAVFLDQFPNINAFLAKYFVNRGQTDNRWELKPHALEPFYRSLSHWCIFLSNPAVYGWKDNCETLPPINVHIDHVDLTAEQTGIVQKETGLMFASQNLGGIVGRSMMGRLAKGTHKGLAIETLKPAWIRSAVDSWPDESTIIWCLYNDEQERLAKLFPEAANISGDTPDETRQELIADFKSGRRRTLISKGKILGFGLNLQIATRMIFSGLQDSYETYYQCVKRANRYGASRPLNVHIPVTEIEAPMIETVLQKAKRVQSDTDAQERMFRNAAA